LLFLALIAAVAAAGAAPHTASAQEPLIVLDVRIVGNEHVPTETIRGGHDGNPHRRAAGF